MKTYKNRFFEFTTGFHGIKLSYSPCAYYNDRVLSFSPWWWVIYIHLWDSWKENDVNDTTNYWFYYNDSSLVIQYWKKCKFINMPWSYDWVRTSYLLKDDSWAHNTKETRLDTYKDFRKWLDLFSERHLFIDRYNSTWTTATIKVEQREWRQGWLKWTSLFNRIRTTIDVEFKEPIWKWVWSWKWWTTGCSYEMEEWEEPFDTLMRMQEDREFN